MDGTTEPGRCSLLVENEIDAMIASFLTNSESDTSVSTIRIPKTIAEVCLCGDIKISITDEMKGWVEPTPEQIKNLHDTFCIDVRLFDEEGDVKNDD